MELKKQLVKAKELVKDIPKEEWLSGAFSNTLGRCCFFGHLARLTSEDSEDYSEQNCKPKQDTWVYDLWFDGNILVDANNFDSKKYQQDNPKDRVIAAIDDLLTNQS